VWGKAVAGREKKGDCKATIGGGRTCGWWEGSRVRLGGRGVNRAGCGEREGTG